MENSMKVPQKTKQNVIQQFYFRVKCPRLESRVSTNYLCSMFTAVLFTRASSVKSIPSIHQQENV
jgi:hypothetical protein